MNDRMNSLSGSALTSALFVLLACLVASCSPNPSDSWSDEMTLDERGGSAPTAAVHAETGRVFWSWFGEDERARPAVFVSTLGPAEQIPSSRTRVSPPDVSVNPHPQAPPQVGVAEDGTVYVAWSTHTAVEGRRFPASNLQVARSTDGGRTFHSPVFVNDDHDGPPAGHTFHDLAVSPDGTIYVAWLDSREAEFGARHAHERHAATSTTVRIARSTDGGQTFEPDVVVARGSCECCRTALHVDEHGTLYLAWRHVFGENTRDIALARSHDGGRSFTEPVRIHEDGWEIEGCPHAGPAVTTDAGENVYVGWYTAAPNRIGLYRAVSSDGGASFREPQALTTDVPISRVDLAPATSGVWILWEDHGEIRIRKSTDPETAVKTVEGRLPSAAQSGGRTAVVWERDGRILAVVTG